MLESGTSRLHRLLLAPAAALVVLLLTSPAQAYTWMIKHHYSGCPTCHADPSGGETLTTYGRDLADEFLRMRYGAGAESNLEEVSAKGSMDSFDDEEEGAGDTKAAAKKEQPKKEQPSEGPSKFPQFLFGAFDLPPQLLLGGAFRGAWTLKDEEFRVFPMQMDVFGQLRLGDLRLGGSLGLAKVPAGSPHARAAQITADQGNGFNLISRTHYVGMDFMNQVLTLRLGRLNLPYGIRIPEHTMLVRQETRTDRESDQQHGLALAYNGQSLRGELMGIAGNYQISPDEYRERGYSGYLELLTGQTSAVGVSSLVTYAKRDRTTLEPDVLRMAHGPFVRAALAEPLVVLVEADVLKRSKADVGYVAFLQLDVEPIQGLHLLGTGEVFDQGYPENGGLSGAPRSVGSGKPKFGGWASVNWFIYTHFDVRVDAIVRKDDPFMLLGQMHVYL